MPLDIPQVTLDDFCVENDIQSIDFVKIDTEGNEVNVMRGARRLIDKQCIGMIQFEYGGTYVDAKTTLKDVFPLLKRNYIICHLLPQGLLPLEYSEGLETFRYSNWVALSKDLF